MPEVIFVGELDGAVGFDKRNIFAKWKIVPSNNRWRVLEGDANGRTWIAEATDFGEFNTWNDPINVAFACSSLSGWPKMYLEIYSCDSSDRIDIAGYGMCFMPTSAGVHTKDIMIFSPRGSTYDQIAAFFVGGQPRYEDPHVILTPESRVGHQVSSVGVVRMSVNVVLRSFAPNIAFQEAKQSSSSAVASSTATMTTRTTTSPREQ